MSGRSMTPARRLLLAAAALCLASPALMAQGDGRGGGGPPGPATGFRAGQGGPGMGGMMRQVAPSITKESFEQYAKTLKLTDAQKEQAQNLFDAYHQQYTTEEDAAREAARQAMQEARDAGQNGGGNGGGGNAGRNAAGDIMGSMTEFRKHAAEMETAFLRDFKGVLTADQKAIWPKVERARRREKAASGMMVASGERVDLVKIVDGLSLAPDVRADLNPLLDQYETDLDKELAVRAKVNDDVAEQLNKLREQANGDFGAMREKMQPIMQQAGEASAKVQDVNRRYTAKVQAALPEDKRPAFIKAVKETRFADIYGPTPQQRAMDAALAFDDVDDAKKAKIKSLKAQYAKDLEGVNAKLAASTEKAEASGQGMGMGFGGPGGRGPGGGDQESRDLRRQKGELGRNMMEKLNALLNEDQQKRLPPVPQGFPGGGRPGGQGGPGNQGNGQGQNGPQRGRRGGGGGGGG